ncbi:MAG: mechanosensitive ion channel family protein [Bacteroidota bacterium]
MKLLKEFEKWMGDPATARWVLVLVGILLIYLFVQITKRLVSRNVHGIDDRHRSRKMVNISGWAMFIVLIAVVFANQLNGLLLTIGVAIGGFVIALQELVASIAGWVMIVAGRTFRAGDRVEMGGVKGDVIDIGFLRTSIMEIEQWVEGDLYNGRIVMVANSQVFKMPLYNYSGDFPYLWDEIKIPVSYGSDYDTATTIFMEIADELTHDVAEDVKKRWEVMHKKYLIYDARTEPVVTLEMLDNWVEFSIRFPVDYNKRRYVRDQYFRAVLKRLGEHPDIHIAVKKLQLMDQSKREREE